MQISPKPTDPRFRDWEGSEVGRLKIGRYCGRGKGCSLWEYTCDCGRSGVISSTSLLRDPVGCGCGRGSNRSSVTHGMTETPEYEIWCGIKKRCFNKKSRFYSRYGGRGIGMHTEWVESFSTFYNHVGPRPSPEHTIDRVDNDGNYEPGNVRWATKKEQANNRNSNCLLTISGETHTLMQWGELTGIGWGNIRSRLIRGKSPEEAIGAGTCGRNRLGLAGVTRRSTGKFWAEVRVDGKRIRLGPYDSPEEAHVNYLAVKAEVNGQEVQPQ